MPWKDGGINPSKKRSPEEFVLYEPSVDTTSEGG